MRRMILLAGLVLAVGVLLPGSALPGVGGSDLPLKGSVSGTSAHNLATGELHAIWTGRATHFGLATLEVHGQVGIPSPTTLSLSGTWTLTAANGDQLFGTAAGTGTRTDPIHVTFVIDFTSSGGTGRFADATATFTVTMFHTRVALENGISYGEQQATLDGQLSW